MDEQSTEGAREVSRRSELKKLGAGAPVAGSAPTLLTWGAHAGAGSPAPCDCSNNCAIGNCGPEGSNCSCALKTDGTCACFIPACNQPGTVCSVDTDCPPGTACVAACCGQPVCATLCGGAAGAGAADANWG
jgi:hypothetical protein